MRPVSQETTKRKPSAASRIRCFSSLSVRKEGLYVPVTDDYNIDVDHDDDDDDDDNQDIPSLGGVLVIPRRDFMWATAILKLANEQKLSSTSSSVT